MKKLRKVLGISLGIVLGLLLACCLILPRLIDIDQYRPKISKIVNQKINGTFEIGHLQLSLWGQIRIDADHLKLMDSNGQELMSVQNVYFHLPFASFLAGSPVLNLKMGEPVINVVKNQKGQINWLKLKKETPPEVPAETQPGKPPVALPALALNSKLGLELKNAILRYQDEKTGKKTEVNHLNLAVKDISLNRPIEWDLWADLNIPNPAGENSKIEGPIRLKGVATSKFSGSQFESTQITSHLDLDPLVIQIPKTLSKSANEPAHADLSLTASAAKVEVNSLKIQFLSSETQLKGEIYPEVQISPSFKWTAPGSEIKIQGQIRVNQEFTHPQADLKISSSPLDLDQLFNLKDSASKQASPSPSDRAPSSGTQTPHTDYDQLLEPLRSNPLLANSKIKIGLDLQSVRIHHTQFNNLVCALNFKDLIFSVENCQTQLFQGALKAKSRIFFKPKLQPQTPAYDFELEGTQLNLDDAIESQMALFKNTVRGQTSFSVKGSGKSFNSEQAIPSLNVKGTLKVEKATFATIDVMKMIQDGMTQSLAKISEKIPALKGKTIPPLPNTTSRYRVISSGFTIQNGKFNSPDFLAIAEPNQGIDIKGATELNIKTFDLNTSWELTDTYNLTRIKEISVNTQGIEVPHIFAEGDGPFKLPVHAECSVKAPCYSYGQTAEYLTKTALSNIGKALGKRAQQEIKKQVEEKLKKVIPEDVQNKIQEGLKGFFR